MPRDKTHLMASEVPLIDGMVVEVVTVGVVKGKSNCMKSGNGDG